MDVIDQTNDNRKQALHQQIGTGSEVVDQISFQHHNTRIEKKSPSRRAKT